MVTKTMKTLGEYFHEAKIGKWAMGHFNFSTADQLRAIVEAAAELDLPVMAATSEGEANFIGYKQAAALVKSYREEGYKVFLNADHHKSWETAKAAIDAGYDSVLIDASKLAFEENVALTKKVVNYAQEMAKSSGREITVEGELGYLRGSSEVQKKVEISKDDFTKPEEAKIFVAQTGVDRLAIVFGNIHGIVTEQEEHLNIDALKSIAAAVPDVVLVLHGASGLKSEEIKAAIQNGILNIHINTELRVAYHEALRRELEEEPEQTTPYKFLEPSYKATKEVVLEKLKLFRNL